MKLSEPKIQYECCEGRNVLALLEMEPQILGRPAPTLVTIRTKPFQLHHEIHVNNI
jgi:hypothetical protein